MDTKKKRGNLITTRKKSKPVALGDRADEIVSLANKIEKFKKVGFKPLVVSLIGAVFVAGCSIFMIYLLL